MALLKWQMIGVPPLIFNQTLRALRHAVQVDRPGAGPGSLTDEGLRYEVVVGSAVRQYAPALWTWVQETGVALASELADQPLSLYADVDAAVNINRLHGIGERYELHVDSNPVTALWFLTTHEEGGELEVDGGIFKPVRGLFVVFEGSKLPHRVRPMVDMAPRITVPINLKPAGTSDIRPPGLDAHLFGGN